MREKYEKVIRSRMSLETNSFEFFDFLLDGKEKVLLRDNKPISITPKAFEVLQILVENHGHLVERDKLLNAVWAESFVEEGNLTFTIGLLRKTLGEDKQNPRFIETVPKRGYRFIAEVKNFLPESPNVIEPTVQPQNSHQNGWSRRQKSFVVLITFLTATIGIGLWYVRSKSVESNAPILSVPFNLETISTNGKVFSAAISPDGKWVVYTNRNNGKQSVWVRELDSSENVEIIPPEEVNYRQFKFSPDGNSLYFSRQINSANEPAAVYRVPLRGGIPTKIISNVWHHFSLSPDGEKISYHRCCQNKNENYSIWIANSADGQNERKIVSTQFPLRIGDNRISPDGKKIAFAVGQSENEANDFGLKIVDIESGTESELTKDKFFNIKHIEWLPDQSGLLLTASKIPNKQYRIWQVSTVTGEVQPLTKDSANYAVLSLDKSGSRLVSTQTKEDFHLQLRNLENPTLKKILINATRASFAPDGKILFYSLMTGNDEIWSINADGSGQRQLTNNAADDRYPIASPTDGSIFFTSNRTGEAHIWRINADGSNQTQITQTAGSFPLLVSPDGKWVFYHRNIDKTLWRISTNGGKEELILNKRKDSLAISPDGKQVAFAENQGGQKFLQIVNLIDGQIIKNLSIADSKLNLLQIEWLPDGKSLTYIQTDDKSKNSTLWMQTLDGKAKEIADLGDEEIFSLKFAPDGKNFIITQGSWRHDAVLVKGLK